MKKKISLLVFLSVLITTLTDFSGASSEDPLESALLVSAMSISEKEGEYEVSFIYMDYSAEKGGKNDYKILNISSPTIGGAIENAERNSRTKIYFGQMDAVFLQKDIFYDQPSYKTIIDFLQRDPYIGYSIYIYAYDGTSEEFQSRITGKDGRIINFLDEIIIKEPVKGGTDTHLLDIISAYECYTVPIIAKEGNDLLSGILSVDRNGSVNIFPTDIIRPYGILKNSGGEYYFTTYLGEFYTDKVTTRIVYDGEKHFTVNISCVFSSLGLEGYHSLQGKMVSLAEEAFSDAVKRDVTSFIGMIKAHNADLLGASLYMHRFHHDEHAFLMQEGVNFIRDFEFGIIVKSRFNDNGIMY